MGLITKTFSITALGEFLIQSDLNHWCLWIFLKSSAGININLCSLEPQRKTPSERSKTVQSQTAAVHLGSLEQVYFQGTFPSRWMIKKSVSGQYSCIVSCRQTKKTAILMTFRATIIIKQWFKCIFLPAVKWTDLRHIIIIFNHAANLIPFAFFNLCERSELLFADVSFFFGTLKLVFSLNESIKRSQFFKPSSPMWPAQAQSLIKTLELTKQHTGFLSRRVKSGIMTSFNKNCCTTTHCC